MGRTRGVPWGWLERRRAMAFVLAGVLLAVQGVFIGWAVGELVARFELGFEDYWFQLVGFWVWVWFFGAVGAVVGVGALGLYPSLVSQAPRLARAGGLLAALGAAGGLVVASLPVIAVAGHALGLFSHVVDNPLFLVYNELFGPYAAVLSLAISASGVAALWADAPSRLVGGLLLVAAVYPRPPLGMNLQAGLPVPGVIVGVLALVAVGYCLFDGSEPTRPGTSGPPGSRA